MIIELTEKEATELKQKREKMLRLYDKAVREARALRPGAEYPPYTGADGEDTEGVYRQWLMSGSEEWRAAYKYVLKLTSGLFSSQYASEALDKADSRLLKRITDTQDATVKDLKRQVGVLLNSDVVCQKDEETGGFTAIDLGYVRRELQDLFYKPMQTLDEEHKKQVEEYINSRLENFEPKEPRYTMDHGLPSGSSRQVPGESRDGEKVTYTIYYLKKKELAGRKTHVYARPTQYLMTVDKITTLLFNNKLTRPLGEDPEYLYPVDLDKKGRVAVGASLVFHDLLEELKKNVEKNGGVLEAPTLTTMDGLVFFGIITQMGALNSEMTYRMIWRGMSCNTSDNIVVPDWAYEAIDEALEKFRAIFKLEYPYIDSDGVKRVKSYDDPFLSFGRLKDEIIYINGKKIVDGAIAVHSKPPLLDWAETNGNEIDTSDVYLLDIQPTLIRDSKGKEKRIPGLNDTKESFLLKMTLFDRVKRMRSDFNRHFKKKGEELPNNKRSIRYDYVYSAIGVENPNPDKRKDLKKKMDSCLYYWESQGLIAGFEHKRDKAKGNTFSSVWLSFMPKTQEN